MKVSLKLFKGLKAFTMREEYTRYVRKITLKKNQFSLVKMVAFSFPIYLKSAFLELFLMNIHERNRELYWKIDQKMHTLKFN
jgi:hypothetical protein